MSLKESEIEQKLIEKLQDLKYTYRPDIRDKATLEQNFRKKFEILNHVILTDAEFARLRDEIISADVFQAAKTLREYGYFQREDGTPLHYMLVNLRDWCKNDFEVIHQLRINTEYSHHRYDVILLINGVPVVQVELKTLGINPRRAMEQIVQYKNDPGNGYANTLLCFMQLFIVSNRTNTWYFANNQTRHFAFNAEERFLPIYQLAGENNNKITHLDEFADVFLSKCTLGQLISRYMVLVVGEQKLMIMRPYQIYAVKAIVDCIHQNRGNGYIWHTTGSGKTLTSFKASTLLKDNPDIEKCLFVVDRKDLDRQTREEFNRFQKGCVEENTNTDTLVKRLLSEDYADKVIVCTIQKLGLALDENSKKAKQHRERGKQTYKERLEPLRDKRIVIIFDECHRSQFGENHQAIKEFFPRAQLFGFTGTPIFEENATYKQIDGTIGSYRTTKDIFEKQLHAYTITHAIDDNNVLRFHVDYYKVAGASCSQSSKVVGASCSREREQDAPATVWEYFNPTTEIEVRSGGDLPHWEQGSVWYFVTFRLADALPRSVVENLKEQRELWKKTHDINHLSREDLKEYRRLFTERYETLLNAGNGSCVLRDPSVANLVEDALHHFEGERYALDEYVIMPNHVHVLVKPLNGHKLKNIMHSWKSFTANQINQRLGKTGQCWQHESYDHIVRHDRAMEAIRCYIRENPKVAGASCSREREQDAPATVKQQAVVESILEKHDAATSRRRFNALLATGSINDAIAYYQLFKQAQEQRQADDPDFHPLNVACVFSPPAEGNTDVKQLQEDLPQEKLDNQQEPDKKKAALQAIIADYNQQYGTNHSLYEFDLYYQDVQKRIKDQQYPNSDLPHKNKIDLVIVVDMLLTGFDSKYLNTLYVDKNLKHHGLIQAFSRTNRVLNDTKPYGNILDFRAQQSAVDEAIALFSGEDTERAKEIWLVDPAPRVIERYEEAVAAMGQFMAQFGPQGGEPGAMVCDPQAVYNLKGDEARIEFIKRFKEVQRLKTQLDQYTDLDDAQKEKINTLLPEDHLRALRSSYLETAQRLRAQQGRTGDKAGEAQTDIDQLDFEFVLFSSALIDYDYIMKLIARFSQEQTTKQTMTRDQLVNLLTATSNLMDERDDIIAYINTLQAGQGLSEQAIRDGYQTFKTEKADQELLEIADKHRLDAETLKAFVGAVLDRLIFDGEQLSDLFAPLNLRWKDRTRAELVLMEELVPFLKKQTQGRNISGLAAYE